MAKYFHLFSVVSALIKQTNISESVTLHEQQDILLSGNSLPTVAAEMVGCKSCS